MGYFDKYKPYIWDNLDDNKKKEIAIFIFTNIANRLAELNVDTPDKYFSSFSSNDLGFVGELLKNINPDFHEEKQKMIDVYYLILMKKQKSVMIHLQNVILQDFI